MKSFIITVVALLGATVVAGCNGGAGPATGPYPFGTDPTGATSEPTGTSTEMPPSGGQGSSIAQQCQTVCARIAAACPSYASSTCVTSCSQVPTQYPSCTSELQAFLTCLASAQITCSNGSVQVPGCESETLAFASCESPGTTTGTTTTTGAGGTAY